MDFSAAHGADHLIPIIHDIKDFPAGLGPPACHETDQRFPLPEGKFFSPHGFRHAEQIEFQLSF